MAKTVINLSDPISTLVTKTNTISDNLGDVATIATGDSDVVKAINSLNTRVTPFDDSSEIRAFTLGAINVDSTDSATGIFLTYDSAAARIGLNTRYTFSAGAGLDYNGEGAYNISNLGVTTAMIANTNVTEGKLATDAVATAKIADLAVTNAKIANTTLTSAKFNSAVSLQILDSTGSVLKTLHSPGS